MGEADERIAALRRQIDEVDSRILELLNRRAEIVIEVGKAKAAQQVDFHVPQREEQIHARLAAANRGPFPTAALRPVYREILSACRWSVPSGSPTSAPRLPSPIRPA